MRPEEVSKFDVKLERGQVQIQSGKSAAARRILDLTAESHAILAGECQVQGRGFSRHRASLATTSAGYTVLMTACAPKRASHCASMT